jgi:hypothetical protein
LVWRATCAFRAPRRRPSSTPISSVSPRSAPIWTHVAEAKENGFVRTLFGRRINTPGINQRARRRAGAKRAAINAPIQGAAADIIRRAMIRMPEAIRGICRRGCCCRSMTNWCSR